MPQKYIDQAKHNESFLQISVNADPDNYFDWKCTVLYYAALFYMKAFLVHKGHPPGKDHIEVQKAIKPSQLDRARRPRVKEHIYEAFIELYDKALSTRYEFDYMQNPLEAQKNEFIQLQANLEEIKKYIKRQGVNI